MLLKEFYYNLIDVLLEYSSNNIDENKARHEIENLLCDAEDSNLDVNASPDLIDDIYVDFDDWSS